MRRLVCALVGHSWGATPDVLPGRIIMACGRCRKLRL